MLQLPQEKARLFREEARVAREKALHAGSHDLRDAYEQMATDWIYLAEQAELLVHRRRLH